MLAKGDDFWNGVGMVKDASRQEDGWGDGDDLDNSGEVGRMDE